LERLRPLTQQQEWRVDSQRGIAVPQ